MPIKKKSSINKINYEASGQMAFFGRDNLAFKTVNLPKSLKYNCLCIKFKIKKIINIKKLDIYFLEI